MRRGGALVVLVSSVCQSVYWPELDSPSALCLGLPVTKPEDWDRESLQYAELCSVLKLISQDRRTRAPPPPQSPSFQSVGICSSSGWGSLTALYTHFMWPISNLLIWWLNSSSSSSFFFFFKLSSRCLWSLWCSPCGKLAGKIPVCFGRIR